MFTLAFSLGKVPNHIHFVNFIQYYGRKTFNEEFCSKAKENQIGHTQQQGAAVVPVFKALHNNKSS